MSTATDPLAGQRYLSLSTRKKNGDWVNTPIWFARTTEGGPDCWVAYTLRDSWKVKRLRNFAGSKVAACTMQGRVTGPWIETSTEVMDDPEFERRAYDTLLRKYGFQMRVANFIASFSRKPDRRAILRIVESTD